MKQRVLTAALLIPPVLLAVFLSSFWPLWVLACIAFGYGYAELRRMAAPSSAPIPFLGPALLISALPLVSFYVPRASIAILQKPGFDIASFTLVATSILGCLGAVLIIRGRRGYPYLELASLWIASPLVAMSLLKLPTVGTGLTSVMTAWQGDFWWGSPILLCLIPLWVGDTLAIFVGKAFGKELLAPKISPKKTVVGAIANLGGCLLAAIGLASLINQPLVVGILSGLSTGLLGQAGDLLESAVKRSAGVKDSGRLLPGHGGLLDRIDSILLSAPLVVLVVTEFGRNRLLSILLGSM